jgi:CIC family chloride channel protein
VRPQLERLTQIARRRAQRPRAIEPVMLALGALTGVATGVAAFVLISLVELVSHLAWSDPAPWWQLLLVPTLGGVVVGVLVSRLAPEVAGGGIVSTMEALAIRGGTLRRRVPWGATLATSLALGTGASGGREGPIVLIGGSLGSALGRLVPLDEDRTRILVAAGAAAGIGATFNAPIGGMLFAIELLLIGLRRAAAVQVIVVAAVAGSVTARQLVGEGLPILRPRPGLALGAPSELLLYAALGVAAVVVAAGFRYGEDAARRAAAVVRRRIGPVATVGLAGLLVGCIALAVPEVLGEGADLPPIDGQRDPLQAMLDVAWGTGWDAAGFLLLLVVAKLLATLVTVSAGSAVGTFAPMLLTGAALGGAFGIVAAQLFGVDVADPGAFALVGMAAVYAATARAPMTAIIIVFELTGSYDLVLPLMLTVGVAMAAGGARGWDSIYVHQLRRRGVVYGQPEDLDVLQTVRVSEVMTRDVPTVPAHLDVASLRLRLQSTGHHGFVVVDGDGKLVGIVTRADLDRPGATVREIATRRVLTAEPDDPVFRAVRRMGSLDVGRLPVLDPVTRRVVGIVRRQDVVRAYQRGIDRSLGAQQRAEAGRLRDLAGVRFVEFVLERDAPVVGQAVRDISWPERSVVTSVRRAGEVVVPDGATVLEAGDELVVLTGDPDAVRVVVTGDGVVDGPR